jgi:hypothetical protein
MPSAKDDKKISVLKNPIRPSPKRKPKAPDQEGTQKRNDPLRTS